MFSDTVCRDTAMDSVVDHAIFTTVVMQDEDNRRVVFDDAPGEQLIGRFLFGDNTFGFHI